MRPRLHITFSVINKGSLSFNRWINQGTEVVVLTLRALLTGTVEGLEIQALAFLPTGARRRLGTFSTPPHAAVGSAWRPLAPFTPTAIH